jgi:phospholipase C
MIRAIKHPRERSRSIRIGSMTRQDNQKSSVVPCQGTSPASQIKHLIVLMLENRSFDHMLGYSGINGIEGLGDDKHLSNEDRNGNVYSVESNAAGVEDLTDPGHDYDDVFTQMFYEPQQKDTCATEPTMSGFAESYRNYSEEPGDALQCYKPENLQVLTYLAKNFAVCDHWFSSVPGPTLPNRLFAHSGTSKGRLDLSADWLDASPTIYEVLDKYNVSSTIYADGWTAAATIPNLLVHQDQFFGTLDDFYQDCADNNLPGYCFLEPRYSSGMVDGTFRPQNDQHPDSDVNEGEQLIYSVYKAIRSHRKVWEHSMLVITYDEHGGLYDHVPPPEAVQPRDNEVSSNPYFDFKRYGVRVPAVIVSPYTPAMVCKDIFDHTSLIATARKLLTGKWQDDALGKRAMSANTFDSVLTLCKPRNEHHDFAPHPSAANPRKAAKLNHLQIDHLRQAYLLDQSRPQHLRVNPNPAWVDRLKAGDQNYDMYSDIKVEDADHYVRNVYAVSRDLKKKKSP